MTPEQIAFVAGVLEGEGCFDFNAPSKKKYPKIRMETTDHDLAYRLQEIIGAGTIHSAKLRQKHHKPSVVFQITKSDTAREVMKLIRPWMSERRQGRIDELLASEGS